MQTGVFGSRSRTHRPDRARFRNPNGVYMNLCNFLALDPSYHGKGLERGGRRVQEISNEFHADQAALQVLVDPFLAAQLGHAVLAVSRSGRSC